MEKAYLRRINIHDKANRMLRPSKEDDDRLSDSMEFFSTLTTEVNYDREFFYDAIIGYLKYIYFTLGLKDKFKDLFKNMGRLFFRKFHDKDALIDKEENYFSIIFHSITPGLRMEVATALSAIPADLNIATINAVRGVATAYFAPILAQKEWRAFWQVIIAEFETPGHADILLRKLQGALLYKLMLSVTEVIKEQTDTKIIIEPLPNLTIEQIKLITKILSSEENNVATLKSIQEEFKKSQIIDAFSVDNYSHYLVSLSDSAKNNLERTLDGFETTLNSTLSKPEFIILAEYGHIALNNHFFEMFNAFARLVNARKKGIKAFAQIVLRHLNKTYGTDDRYESLLKTTLPLYEQLSKFAGKKALREAKPLADKITKLNQTGTPILSLADREPSGSHIARSASADKGITVLLKPKEDSPRANKESPRVSKDGLFKKARENSANRIRSLLTGESPRDKGPERQEQSTPPREVRIAKTPSSSKEESHSKAPVLKTVDTGLIRFSAEAPEARQPTAELTTSKRRSMHLPPILNPPPRATTPQPQRPVTLNPPTSTAPPASTSPRLVDSTHFKEGATHSRRNLQLITPLREGVKNLKAAVTTDEKPRSKSP